jgi:hypothetical protein
VKGVKRRTRDEGGLVRDPEMPDGVERVGEDDSLYSKSVTHSTRSAKQHSDLPYCPCAPGRQDRTSSPIPELLLHDWCQVRTDFQTVVNLVPLGDP